MRLRVAALAAALSIGCGSSAPLDPGDVGTWTLMDRLGGAASAAYLVTAAPNELTPGFAAADGWECVDCGLPGHGGRVFVLTNHGLAKQVIVARGTQNFDNVIADLSYSKQRSDELDCDLHSGFMEAAKEAWVAVQGELRSGYALTFAGHSLGGAIAVISAMHAVVAGCEVERVVTFGQPMVTDQQGAELWDRKLEGLYVRVVHGDDPVTLLPGDPPGSEANAPPFTHFGMLIHFDRTGLNALPARTEDVGDNVSGEREEKNAAYWLDVLSLNRIPLQEVSDHGMAEYLSAIEQRVARIAPPEPEPDPTATAE